MTDDARTKRLAMLSARNKRSRASKRRMVVERGKSRHRDSDTCTIGEAAAAVVVGVALAGGFESE